MLYSTNVKADIDTQVFCFFPFGNIKSSTNSTFWGVTVSQRPAVNFPSFMASDREETHLNASLTDEIVCVAVWTGSPKWRLCFGLCPACCATTVELSCLACHLIDAPGAFNVLQPQPAKTKLHKNDTREKSPWVSHKTLAQNSSMSQNTWRRRFITQTCGIWPKI